MVSVTCAVRLHLELPTTGLPTDKQTGSIGLLARRAMSTLLRCLKFCLTSEGQQAVLAAVICLVALQIFVDDAAALQVNQKLVSLIPSSTPSWPPAYC